MDAPAVVGASGDRQPSGTAVIPEAAANTGRAGEDLLAVLKNSELGRQVEVTARPGKVNLEISDSILFTPASAALSATGLALLDQLAAILRTLPYELSVEGHTDNVPIHTPRYPSNWELSAARAAMVTRKLIDQGIAADRVRAIGYGDTRPRSDNLSPEGRARNRRVTFVLQVPGGD
jgi:chemotaxis protein MotB